MIRTFPALFALVAILGCGGGPFLVFPGGALDDSDAEADIHGGDDGLTAWRAAALRELVEETGIWLTIDGADVTDTRPDGAEVFDAAPALLDADALQYFANWITPAPLPIRFDTKFFVAEVGRRIELPEEGAQLRKQRRIGVACRQIERSVRDFRRERGVDGRRRCDPRAPAPGGEQ